MGHHALFYESQNGDRSYGADSFSALLNGLFGTGVSRGRRNNMTVSVKNDTTITVASGFACIEGKARDFDTATDITVTFSQLKGKTSYVVVRRDDNNRDITLKVVQTRYASMTNGVQDITLATLTVTSNAASLTASSGVTLTVNNSRFLAQRADVPDEDLWTQKMNARFDEIVKQLTATGTNDLTQLQSFSQTVANCQARATTAETTANAANSAITNLMTSLGLQNGTQNVTFAGLMENAGGLTMDRIIHTTYSTATAGTARGEVSIPSGVNLSDYSALYVVLDSNVGGADSGRVGVLLEPGCSAVAVAAYNGLMVSRQLYWTNASTVIPYFADVPQKNKVGSTRPVLAATQTVAAGKLFARGAYAGTKNTTTGDNYTSYNTTTWYFSKAAACTAKNTANTTANAKYLPVLRIVEVYGIRGIKR